MLRCKISSDYGDLDKLYETLNWIPNSVSVRPAPAILEEKARTMIEIDEKWVTFRDYILFRVFGRDFGINEDGKFYAYDQIIGMETRLFKPNAYPYSIDYGNHWVMWYGSENQPYCDEQINADIETAVKEMVRADESYDFAWYENPKMSVPAFYHVHVFWIKFKAGGEEDTNVL